METAIGVGNLVGGFALGLVATRVAKGRLIIAAYTIFGLLVFLVGFIPTLPVMLGLMFGIGVANMAFVIPSQTLFQERTPPELMARVVSFRFALVFGGMTIATTFAGLVANVTGVGPVIVVAGLISVVAGLAGLLLQRRPGRVMAAFVAATARGRYTVGRVRRRPQAHPRTGDGPPHDRPGARPGGRRRRRGHD